MENILLILNYLIKESGSGWKLRSLEAEKLGRSEGLKKRKTNN